MSQILPHLRWAALAALTTTAAQAQSFAIYGNLGDVNTSIFSVPR